jgi:hypothetical protein
MMICKAKMGWAYSSMRESDPARKYTFDLLLEKRTVGKPKTRWIKEVERKLKGMGVNDWKR